VFELVAS
jgi:hypothetical protein